MDAARQTFLATSIDGAGTDRWRFEIPSSRSEVVALTHLELPRSTDRDEGAIGVVSVRGARRVEGSSKIVVGGVADVDDWTPVAAAVVRHRALGTASTIVAVPTEGSSAGFVVDKDWVEMRVAWGAGGAEDPSYDRVVRILLAAVATRC